MKYGMGFGAFGVRARPHKMCGKGSHGVSHQVNPQNPMGQADPPPPPLWGVIDGK